MNFARQLFATQHSFDEMRVKSVNAVDYRCAMHVSLASFKTVHSLPSCMRDLRAMKTGFVEFCWCISLLSGEWRADDKLLGRQRNPLPVACGQV